MGDSNLTEQLKNLRKVSGNPSARQLEQLIKRQSGDRRMSKSTIQDKFSGKSRLKPVHALALVQACGDYAASIGIEIGLEELSAQTWLDRIAALDDSASKSNTDAIIQAAEAPIFIEEARGAAAHDLDQVITSLLNAGMIEVAKRVREGSGKPLEEWMPATLTAINRAGMNDDAAQKVAIRVSALQAVKIMMEIELYGDEDTARRYFWNCLVHHPPQQIPKLLVALRLDQSDVAPYYADQFIDILSQKQRTIVLRNDLAKVIQSLRAAHLDKDADKLSEGIGRYAWPPIALKVAANFPESFLGDREKILYSAGESGPQRVALLVKAVIENTIPGMTFLQLLQPLFTAVGAEKAGDAAEAMIQLGLDEAASQFLLWRDEAL